jgi:hypothetical protein
VLDQVSRSQRLSSAIVHETVKCLPRAPRVKASPQVGASFRAPGPSEFLVYFVGDLAGNYLAHDVTLQIDRVGAVHRVIGPYGRAVHIHSEILGMDAVIECH